MSHQGVRIIATDGGSVIIATGPYPGQAQLIVNPDGTITNGAGVPIGGGGGTVTNPLAGDLSAGSHKITSLASGSAGTDAANVSQLPTAAQLVPTSPADATKVLLGTSPPSFGAAPGGGGDFKADGSVPATGDFDMAQNAIEGVEYIAITGTDPAYTSTFLEVNDQYNLCLGFDTHVPSNVGSLECVYIGSEAGKGHANFVFSNCTAIGANALRGNTNGGDNTVVGHDAMIAGSGGENTGVGSRCLGDVTTNVSGYDNCAFGYRALPALTSGNNNVGVGIHAGKVISTGTHNICIGDESGANPGGGARSAVVAIGAGALATQDGMIIIGALSEGAPCVIAGTGAPVDASHPDGSIYLRADGGALTTIYQARSSVWVGIL